MPAASNALLPNLKSLLFAIGEVSTCIVACFLHSSTHMCLKQTPGRRPTRITGRFVNTVTRGWVGAPNDRAPFRFHAAVVGLSIDVCRGLGISPLRINIWLSFLRPMTMETRCCKKKKKSKYTRHKISVPLAMRTNVEKKSSNLKKKRKKYFLGRYWAKIGPRKAQPNVNSKRRDSESSPDIDRLNQRLRHEI